MTEKCPITRKPGKSPYTLCVKKNRGWYAVYSGPTKLSKSFRSQDAAEKWLEKHRVFAEYWAGSTVASVNAAVARGESIIIEIGLTSL